MSHRIAHLLAADANWPQSRPVVSWAPITDFDRGYLRTNDAATTVRQRVMFLCIAVGVIGWAAWKAIR